MRRFPFLILPFLFCSISRAEHTIIFHNASNFTSGTLPNARLDLSSVTMRGQLSNGTAVLNVASITVPSINGIANLYFLDGTTQPTAATAGTASSGDGLGSHIATETVNGGGFGIVNVSSQGIGTLSPSSKLDINGGSLTIRGTSAGIQINSASPIFSSITFSGTGGTSGSTIAKIQWLDPGAAGNPDRASEYGAIFNLIDPAGLGSGLMSFYTYNGAGGTTSSLNFKVGRQLGFEIFQDMSLQPNVYGGIQRFIMGAPVVEVSSMLDLKNGSITIRDDGTFITPTGSSAGGIEYRTRSLTAFRADSKGLTVVSTPTANYDARFTTATDATIYHLAVTTYGHVLINGPQPTVGTCGTGSPSVVGTDNFGTITLGGGAPTACTLTFANPWGATPTCVVSDNSTAVTPAVTSISASALTIGLSLTATTVYYSCGGTK